MNLVEEIEKRYRDIQAKKKIIASQKKFILSDKENKDLIQELNQKINKNEKELINYESDFINFIYRLNKENHQELTSWLNLHIKTIKNIENFSKQKLQLNQSYTKTRLQTIEKIKKDWKQFPYTLKYPDTYTVEEYQLFYDIINFENSFTKPETEISKIKEIEHIRQKLTELHKDLFHAETVLDKGGAWGMPAHVITEAEEKYKKTKEQQRKYLLYYNQTFKEISEKYSNTKIMWQLFHLYTCIYIVNHSYTTECSAKDKESVRINLAKDYFYAWQQMKFEYERPYFVANVYYLSDYDNLFNLVFDNLQLK
jgi:hypothetical protein